MKRVGTAGNRTRYQSGAYVSTCESGQSVNLSGTAIINEFITVSSNKLEAVFCISEKLIYKKKSTVY